MHREEVTHESTASMTAANIQRVAHAVRDACVRAAIDGYEQGGISGLCAEGRFEMAVDSVRTLDLDGIACGVKD